MAHSKCLMKTIYWMGGEDFRGSTRNGGAAKTVGFYYHPEPKRGREKGAGDVEGAVVRAACGPCQSHSTAQRPRQNALTPSWSTFWSPAGPSHWLKKTGSQRIPGDSRRGEPSRTQTRGKEEQKRDLGTIIGQNCFLGDTRKIKLI